MSLVIGLGCSVGARAAAARALVARALGGDRRGVYAVATVDRRRDEPALRAVAGDHALDLWCYPAERLDRVEVPHPSAAVRGHVGTASVAEAAALLAAAELGGASLVVPKLRGEHVTVAVAEVAPLSVSSACTACGACLLTCPEHALLPAPGRPVVLGSRCTSCGECVEVCPADAISLAGE